MMNCVNVSTDGKWSNLLVAWPVGRGTENSKNEVDNSDEVDI